jgi:hypothetical protein
MFTSLISLMNSYSSATTQYIHLLTCGIKRKHPRSLNATGKKEYSNTKTRFRAKTSERFLNNKIIVIDFSGHQPSRAMIIIKYKSICVNETWSNLFAKRRNQKKEQGTMKNMVFFQNSLSVKRLEK